MKYPAIKFIYFDLGNVLVNFSHSRASENLAAIANISSQRVQAALFDSGLQTAFETGQIDDQEMTNQLNSALNLDLSISQINHAISDIFWLNPSMIPVVTQLYAAQYPIGILSNTCSAHWNYVLRHFQFLGDFFPIEKRVLSFESRCMKPDSKIYTDAITIAGMEPETIFFMDDRRDNVDGALAAGMQAELYQSASQIADCLINRGVRVNL